ncbi:hypothetical protein [Pasteuria penetrans]|uniref:hypothetical protein n=1 Tax=Pasteuria penetrans TaxID=86005 RepID=UPI000FC30C3D|nr:hypothetical protein [Pasteuria penetrans]
MRGIFVSCKGRIPHHSYCEGTYLGIHGGRGKSSSFHVGIGCGWDGTWDLFYVGYLSSETLDIWDHVFKNICPRGFMIGSPDCHRRSSWFHRTAIRTHGSLWMGNGVHSGPAHVQFRSKEMIMS